ncbi:UNVERIFIED_CONTAM: hypothetical protein K2H54_062192 [Gekko kuhli]
MTANLKRVFCGNHAAKWQMIAVLLPGNWKDKQGCSEYRFSQDLPYLPLYFLNSPEEKLDKQIRYMTFYKPPFWSKSF